MFILRCYQVCPHSLYTQSAYSTVLSFVDASAQYGGVRPNLITVENKEFQSQSLIRLAVPYQGSQTGKATVSDAHLFGQHFIICQGNILSNFESPLSSRGVCMRVSGVPV